MMEIYQVFLSVMVTVVKLQDQKRSYCFRATGSYGHGDLCFYVNNDNDNDAVVAADEKVRITRQGELRIAARNTNNAGDLGFRFGSLGLRTEDVGGFNWWRIDAHLW